VSRDGAVVPRAEPRSYYGRPVIKQPAWTWEVPVYLFAGGMAGVSAPLAFAAERAGNRELARAAWGFALAGLGASPLLLVKDLGRPERLLNMLRVFKVTSPMSMGVWLLTAMGPATAAAAATPLTGRPVPGRAAAAPAAALLGLPLATYTGVLLANTAVPAWHEARRELPFVFGGSAAASAGAAAVLVTGAGAAAPARRLAVGGAAGSLAAAALMERRLGPLGQPYRRGAPGVLARASRASTAAGAMLMALRGARAGAPARAAAGLLLAGSFLERWAVFRAGFASAADPSHTVGPQRERLERRRA
jgi:hypothetical protein